MSEGAFRVALTFDTEHPDRSWCPPGTTDLILDVLEARDVRATFFVQGRWAESQAAAANRIAGAGHLVGHHSHYHARMSLLHDDGITADLEDGRRANVEHTGVDPRPWFRCPFGAGSDDDRVLGVLEELGYRDIDHDVVLEDWETARTGAAILADALHETSAAGDPAVVLFHAWPTGTLDALPELIDGLRSRGARFVRIDELERYRTMAPLARNR
jgi:peptidoglycan/xylan/chitin deacetylase (PgdA/CDA1 family)